MIEDDWGWWLVVFFGYALMIYSGEFLGHSELGLPVFFVGFACSLMGSAL